MPGDVTRLYRVRYLVEDKSAPGLKSVRDKFVGVNLEVDSAIGLVGQFSDRLAGLQVQTQILRDIEIAFRRIDYAALDLAKTTAAVAGGFAKIGAAKGALEALTGAQVKAQRSAYGWKKNLEEANLELAKIIAKNPGLAAHAGAIAQVGAAAETAKTETTGMSLGMAGFLVKMAGLSLATSAVHAFGDAMKEARDFATKTAEEVIGIRDGLRELANLQGKAGVDDATLKTTIGLRQASGMTDAEAKQFQEQYLGSRPLAVDKGNITKDTADKASTEIARSAVRVGLDAKTAGDLAGSIGSFGKIESSNQAVGQVQQIIDQLNDGRGNLTPLVKELMKGGAATVGQGNAFRSISERAAALKVTTGIVGAPAQSSTALGAAIRGLTGFTKAQGKTLSAYGVESGQDLPTMLEKIAPLLEWAEKEGKSPTATLAEAGFGNVQDRNAIVGLVKNRRVLRDSVEEVREAEGSRAKAEKSGTRASDLNREFFGKDKAAANRVADANLTAGKVTRGLENESLAIARKNAEGQLIAEKKLETPLTNLSVKMANLVSFSAVTGSDARQDLIDARVRDNLRSAGTKAGIRLPRRSTLDFGSDEWARDELNKYGPAIQAAGQNPYGESQVVAKKLDKIVEVLERNAVPGVNARPLPEQPLVVGERR